MHVDRGRAADRKVEQRHEKQHRSDGIDNGPRRHPAVSRFPDSRSRPGRFRHRQHEHHRDDPADKDQLSGRHRLARVLYQRVADDKTRHPADHFQDRDAVRVDLRCVLVRDGRALAHFAFAREAEVGATKVGGVFIRSLGSAADTTR